MGVVHVYGEVFPSCMLVSPSLILIVFVFEADLDGYLFMC